MSRIRDYAGAGVFDRGTDYPKAGGALARYHACWYRPADVRDWKLVEGPYKTLRMALRRAAYLNRGWEIMRAADAADRHAAPCFGAAHDLARSSFLAGVLWAREQPTA